MKYILKFGYLVLLAASITGCLSSQPQSPGEKLEEEDYRASLILRKAHFENSKGRHFLARELVTPLLNHSTAGREAKLLMKEIEFNIQFRHIRREQDLSGKVALNEVEKRMLLPDSMNQTRKYVPQVGPFKVEKGPAEELLNKPIDVDLENADIAGVLEALRQVEGLSFIADEGIETTNTLTIKINQVPLRDVLGYIERNMGLMFHVTKDVVWVMQGGEEDAPKGPNLETKIIHLKKGYFPGGSSSSSSTAGGGNSNGLGGSRPGGGGLGNIGGNTGGNSRGGAASSSGEDDLLDALDAFFADDGTEKPEGAKFQIFRNRNILIIRDTRENIRMVQELIDAFDRDPMQVVIETRFITVSKGDLSALGTQINSLNKSDQNAYEFLGVNLADGISDAEADIIQTYLESGDGIKSIFGGTTTAIGESTASFNLNGVLDNFTFDLTLSMLDSLNSAKTLEAPRVTVTNNHQARIRRGTTFYYYEEFSGGETNFDDEGNPIGIQGAVPEGRPSEINEGLTLEVTPSVGNDGKSINMTINLNQTNIDGFETVVAEGASYKLPSPSETDITTTVVVGSGETVVLGGTASQTIIESEKKVPLLGDIPILGWLFKYRSKSREPEHLIIFVTAHVLDIDGRQKLAVEKEEAAMEAAKILAKTSLNPADLLKDDPNPTDLKKAADALRDAGIDPANILKEVPEEGEEDKKEEKSTPKTTAPTTSRPAATGRTPVGAGPRVVPTPAKPVSPILGD